MRLRRRGTFHPKIAIRSVKLSVPCPNSEERGQQRQRQIPPMFALYTFVIGSNNNNQSLRGTLNTKMGKSHKNVYFVQKTDQAMIHLPFSLLDPMVYGNGSTFKWKLET